MQKRKYISLILLISLIFEISYVVADTTIQVSHSDYFKEAVLTPEKLNVEFSGITNDPNGLIQFKLGERRLISSTPVKATKLSDTQILTETYLDYEVSSDIFTTYTYLNAYPNAYEKTDNEIEWLYLRTATDWGITQSEIFRYHLKVYYNSIVLGTPNTNLGFQGYVGFNFFISPDIVPSFVKFTDLDAEVDTIAFESTLISAVVSKSEITPIGEYDTYYIAGSKVSLGAVDFNKLDANALASETPSTPSTGEFDLGAQLRAMELGVDSTGVINPESEFSIVPKQQPFTIGEDFCLNNMKSFLSIQPDVTKHWQTITGKVIQYPHSLDIDTRTGFCSPSEVVNEADAVVTALNNKRYTDAYVQNYNYKNTYHLRFSVKTTMEVKTLSGTPIELGIPVLNIADRYIDLTFKGQTGADVTIGVTPPSIWDGIKDFFANIFSSIGGIIGFIAGIVILALGLYLLVRFGVPLIASSVGKKAKAKIQKQKTIKPREVEQ